MGEFLNNQVLAGCLLEIVRKAEKWRFLSKKSDFFACWVLAFFLWSLLTF